ncbi:MULTISPECIES: hypothetical protein [Corynebacterium]|uniref:hypothetical protein n=1 Tax=Corynebacterium TaxID=1716 RepID=UPI0008A1227F|nr:MULTISPECIES: hypothetical protein [Corynebacterium]MDK8890915.1 hypothetical protein [Corynebacterium macclintockiae]OFM58336.1 hypothetical protein HMPREF2678_09375 [Corynebacterium sp. HMSC058E07]
MSDPNPYGQPGQDFGGPNQPNQPNQSFPAQQPQQPQQFGSQNQYNSQGSKGLSLQWNRMSAIAVGVSALLVLIVSFFPWVGFTIGMGNEGLIVRINGWGHVAERGISGSESLDDTDWDFGNVGLGVLFMILVLGVLIGAAVMLWLKAQSRIAVFMTIGSGALLLIWVIVTFVQFNGSFKKVESDFGWLRQEEDEMLEVFGDYLVGLDGGPKFGIFVAILLALAIIALGVIAIVKYGQQLNATGSNVSNQFGQPQGQPQTQPQPGNQNPFNQPGQ